MKIRSIALAAVAVLATSSAFAAAPTPAPKAAEPQPAARAHTLVEGLAASMRDVLRAVTPEVALPKIELKLAPLDGASR
jgi:hypothetical protein